MTQKKFFKELTSEDYDKLKEHNKKWIAAAFSTQTVDVPKVTKLVKELYKVSNLPEPEVIVVPSPLTGAFVYGAAAAIWESRYNKTKLTIDKNNKLYNLPETDIVSKLIRYCYRAAGARGLELTKDWYKVYQAGAYWNGDDAYITSWRDVFGLDFPEYKNYKPWEELSLCSPFRIIHDKFCIVTDFPEILKMDDQNRAHCADGPSHRWRDGWELYYWHGVSVPKEWIMNKKSLTPEIALGWSNVEQRRAACEILGWNNIIKKLNGKVIDEDDPDIGKLIEVDINGRKEKFLQVLCGTGREFALPVPPEMKTALEAQSWTWGLPPKLFIKPEIRT